MGKNVFSVPIFLIVFRETLEAAIIVSVLLGLVEQIVHDDGLTPLPNVEKVDNSSSDKNSGELAEQPVLEDNLDDAARKRRFIRRMRWQIFAGSIIGLIIACAIGAAFIAVWFTKASDLWAKSEDLWEGTRRLPISARNDPTDFVNPRYLRVDCCYYDLRYGRHHVEDGSRQG